MKRVRGKQKLFIFRVSNFLTALVTSLFAIHASGSVDSGVPPRTQMICTSAQSKFQAQLPAIPSDSPGSGPHGSPLRSSYPIEGGIELIPENVTTDRELEIPQATTFDLDLESVQVQYSEPDGTTWNFSRITHVHAIQEMPQTPSEPARFLMQFEAPDFYLMIESRTPDFGKIANAQITMPEVNHGQSQNLNCLVKIPTPPHATDSASQNLETASSPLQNSSDVANPDVSSAYGATLQPFYP